ncbi:MAG: oligosaccharide flippase family protein, partial [Candidatus Dormibacteria bacterium]
MDGSARSTVPSCRSRSVPAMRSIAVNTAESAPAELERGSAARGSAALALGAIATGGGNYAFSVALAYIVSRDAFGVIGIVQGFLLFAAWFTTAGFPWTVSRRLSATTDPAARAAALRGATVGNLVVATVLAGVLLILLFVGALHLGSESATPVIVGALACSVAGINGAARGALQGLLRFRTVALVNVLEVVVKLGVGLSLAAVGLGPTGAAFGILAGLVAASCVSLWALRDLPVARVSGLGGKALVRETAPLFAATAGMALITSLDLFGVKVLTPSGVSNSAAALYLAAVTLARVPYFLATALTAAVFAHVVRVRDRRDAAGLYVRKGVLYIVALLSPLSLALMALPEPALHLLFPAQYAAAAPALRVAAGGTIFLGVASFLVGALQAMGRDRRPALVVLAAVGVDVIGLAVSVPIGSRAGGVGALIAAASAFDVAVVLATTALFAMCWRLFRWRLSFRRTVAFLICAAVFVVLLEVIPHENRLELIADGWLAACVYVVLTRVLRLLSPGDFATVRSAIPIAGDTSDAAGPNV